VVVAVPYVTRGDAESSRHRRGGEPFGRQPQYNEFARRQAEVRRFRRGVLTGRRQQVTFQAPQLGDVSEDGVDEVLHLARELAFP
jgi:hypothetical protein